MKIETVWFSRKAHYSQITWSHTLEEYNIEVSHEGGRIGEGMVC